jgi:hypothetical protein
MLYSCVLTTHFLSGELVFVFKFWMLPRLGICSTFATYRLYKRRSTGNFPSVAVTYTCIVCWYFARWITPVPVLILFALFESFIAMSCVKHSVIPEILRLLMCLLVLRIVVRRLECWGMKRRGGRKNSGLPRHLRRYAQLVRSNSHPSYLPKFSYFARPFIFCFIYDFSSWWLRNWTLIKSGKYFTVIHWIICLIWLFM